MNDIDKKNEIMENSNNKRNIKNINYGIEILRTFMSYGIVLIHVTKKEKISCFFFTKFIYDWAIFYVPTFYIISFYFSFNILEKRNIKKIKDRLKKIFIPYFIWPIFFWFSDIILNYKTITIDKRFIISIINQLLIGSGYYTVLWFLFDMIMITCILVIIIFIFKNRYITIIGSLYLSLYLIRIDYEHFFDQFKTKRSVKHIISSFMYSIIGLYFRKISIAEKLKDSNEKYLLLLIFFVTLVKEKKNLLSISYGFNVIVIGLFSSWLFLFALSLNLNFILKFKIKNIIKQLTSYTGGIYYIHVGIRQMLFKYFKILILYDFKSSIVN